MHYACASVLKAKGFMMITVGSRMREMALLGEVHGVLDKLTHTGYKGPDEQP